MAAQLALLPEVYEDFRIDDATKEVGRLGIAQARATLAASRQPWRVTDEPVDDAVVGIRRGVRAAEPEHTLTAHSTAHPAPSHIVAPDRSSPTRRARRAAA